MELIPIIKASLGIFTILTSITLTVSYFIYKLKDRKRVKPYDKKTEIKEPLKVIELPVQKLKNNRFKIVNEREPIPAKINSDFDLQKIARPVEEREDLVVNRAKKNSENEVFNIYNLYSNNDARPMHKLKLEVLAAGS